MKYGILHPRKTPEAIAHNEQLLGAKTLGIEVTIPELAAKCGLGNIDPQHLDNEQKSAIEKVIETWDNWENVLTDDSIMVTVRPDLDSIGAMAIIEILLDQKKQFEIDPNGSEAGKYAYYSTFGLTDNTKIRVDLVAKSDFFERGDWKPYSLPTEENPWLKDNAPAANIQPLAAMAAAVADFKVPIEDRVMWMIDWLLFGKEPGGYRDRVEKERTDMIHALENGQIKIEKKEFTSLNFYNEDHANTLDIVMVTSTHRAATMIGYSIAPVVIAINPEFMFQGGEPHRKITICQYQNGYLDLKKVADSLNLIEPGWGGSTTIIGSPQGKGSVISVAQLWDAIQGILE